MKRITTLLFAAFMLFGISGSVMGQLPITDFNVAVTEDFNGFDGSGFDSSPAAGQLNSNTWRITGMSDGDGTFGGTHDSGDFAKGISVGGVTTGGTYSFDAGLGTARVLGFQPTGSDFIPGTVTLSLLNNTGGEITELDISYDIYVFNDQGRANSFNFAHSSDDNSYTSIGALDYTTPEAADGSPAWFQITRTTTISGLSIGNGEPYYMQWQSADVSGGGSRDEFGLTNLSITADGVEGEDPAIVASPLSLTGFEYVEGSGPSDEQSFTVSGTNLEADITITPPTNYEISTGTGGSFVATNPITLAESDGEVPSTTIYVRLKAGLTEGSYNNENIQLTSTNADQVNVVASGEVVEAFGVPYSNEFRTQADYDLAVAQGFTISDANQETGSGGYLRINGQGYAETPTIDFTEFDHLETKFDIEPWGTGSNREFSVLLSNDDGATFDVIASYELPESYTTFTTELDLTDEYNVSDGRIQFKMTDGTGRTRFRDLEINVIYTTEITGNAGWRMLSFPVTGGTVADISDDMGIQGVTDGDNEEFDPNFYYYDDSGSWTVPANVSTAFGDGYGFIAYFFDTNITGSELPNTLDISGTEPDADVAVTLNSTEVDGSTYYTLVGNPFASNYDLSEFTSTGTGTIGNNVHFWDAGEGSYEASDRTTPFITSSWQGFWVESADGATELTFPTSGKTTDAATSTFFSKSSGELHHADISFTLSSEHTFDKAIRLSFREYAELGWDVADASKFTPLVNPGTPYATMAFVGEDKLQSVFSLPFNLDEDYEVKLTETLVDVSGEFTFAWQGMEALPSEWTLTLHDYQTGESIDMMLAGSYTFEAEANSAEKAQPLTILKSPAAQIQKAKADEGPRFGITISKGEATNNESEQLTPSEFKLFQNYPNPFNPTTSIRYAVPKSGKVNLTVYNVMGQNVTSLVNENKSAGTYQVSWDASNMASGIYYYRLQAAGTVLTRQMTLIK